MTRPLMILQKMQEVAILGLVENSSILDYRGKTMQVVILDRGSAKLREGTSVSPASGRKVSHFSPLKIASQLRVSSNSSD